MWRRPSGDITPCFVQPSPRGAASRAAAPLQAVIKAGNLNHVTCCNCRNDSEARKAVADELTSPEGSVSRLDVQNCRVHAYYFFYYCVITTLMDFPEQHRLTVTQRWVDCFPSATIPIFFTLLELRSAQRRLARHFERNVPLMVFVLESAPPSAVACCRGVAAEFVFLHRDRGATRHPPHFFPVASSRVFNFPPQRRRSACDFEQEAARGRRIPRPSAVRAKVKRADKLLLSDKRCFTRAA